MLEITEILGRSAQGITRPFRCQCADGRLYFVKGNGAGRRSLICEWLAGHLAKAFGLPIPEFEIAIASKDLVDLYPEGAELGAGPAFASLILPHAQELSLTNVPSIGIGLQRDVLVFDWWVRNQDRTLTAINGNPNLLWSTAGGLAVIDHNVAFDRDFDPSQFSQGHVFSPRIAEVFDDLVEHGVFATRLREALTVWSSALANTPEEWWFVDDERTIHADFNAALEYQLLTRCSEQDFWRL